MLGVAELFGNPHKGSFKVVHVAGTNGKGSVSIKVARALQKLGFKVGMFISPHISTFRRPVMHHWKAVGQGFPMVHQRASESPALKSGGPLKISLEVGAHLLRRLIRDICGGVR